jgi:hypothetical protein
LAVAEPGCTRANALFCDVDTPCPDNVACDLVARECLLGDLDAGPGQSCDLRAQCNHPATPICDGHEFRCRECRTAAECLDNDPDLSICTREGRCVECVGSADCMDPTRPVCGEGVCLGCGGDSDCQRRDVAAPYCAADGRCVGCRDHDDCGSAVCDLDEATCVAAHSVVYVDGTVGTDVVRCGTAALPCASISAGLSRTGPGRRTLRLAPSLYHEAPVLNAISTRIIGIGAQITSPQTAGPAVLTAINNAEVAVDGVTLFSGRADGADPASGAGIRCDGSAVRLRRVVVEGNQGPGILATAGCRVLLEDSLVRDNKQAGLSASSAFVTVERSRVEDNRGGGVAIVDSRFQVVNNFIVRNGGSRAGFGGVSLAVAGLPSPQVFEFNTVADNQSASTGVRGVSCAVGAVFGNNIVYGGGGGPAVSGSCRWQYSNIEGGAVGPNLDVDPGFVDPERNDYHLGPNSPCEGAADPASAVHWDIDRDPRPAGTGPDIGADELGG